VITVHHLDDSRSQRVIWLLEELGLEYNLIAHKRDPKTLAAPAALKAIHPLGKAPVLLDGESTLAESGAVVETLVERYGQGRLAPAPGTPDRERYLYWLHYAEGSVMPAVVLRLIFSSLPRQPMPIIARPVVRQLAKGVIEAFVQPQIKLHFDHMERQLARTAWFAGDSFTAADVMMSFPIEAMAPSLKAEYPKLFRFLQRIRERPAYRRGLERGGAYDPARLGE